MKASKSPSNKIERYIAREKDGRLFLWSHKPHKDRFGNWTIPEGATSTFVEFHDKNDLLKDIIKWEDDEPWIAEFERRGGNLRIKLTEIEDQLPF